MPSRLYPNFGPREALLPTVYIGGPRDRDPGAILLVALSEPYVRALRDDLLAARTKLRGSGKLLIVSAGTKHCPGLDENLLPVDASLQIGVGGPRLSLNARIARHLVITSATHRWASSAITESLSEVRSASKP